MEDVKWTAEMEVALFRAMQDHKPVGFNKHWRMLCIHNRMQSQGITVTTDAVWKHLREMYDLNSLDDLENTPVPMTMDFQLPPFMTASRIDDGSEEGVASLKRARGVSNSPSPSESPQRTKRKRTH